MSLFGNFVNLKNEFGFFISRVVGVCICLLEDAAVCVLDLLDVVFDRLVESVFEENDVGFEQNSKQLGFSIGEVA